jgi:K+-sensing histidine kinase KdpD
MRTLLLLGALAAALLVAFILLNWAVVAVPMPVSLGLASADLPVGLTVLTLGAALIAALVTYIVAQALSAARARRVHAKAFEAQRSLAEQAEASRFSELRTVMKAEFDHLSSTLIANQDVLRTDIQESANSIAAMLAEIDDRTKSPNRSNTDPH